MTKNKTIYHSFFYGAFWSVLMRWSMKFIGLISTIILARLLTPEDFGIVAMASLVIGLLYSFSEFSVEAFLIREKDIDNRFYNTAWTIKVIQNISLALLLVFISPYAALYFHDNRVISVIHVLAIGTFIQGFQNIGIVFFRKNLNFNKDFQFNLIKRLLIFFVTIGLAFWLKSYWALAISQVIGAFLGVLLSYLFHPFRPRFSLYKIGNILKFSLNILFLNFGKFINNKLDVLVIGGITSTSHMGTYNIASELSTMATKEVVVPVGRGLFPNLSKLSDQQQKLQEAFLYSFGAIAILCFPLGIGLWVVAEDFVLVILGHQWTTTIPLIKWLVIFGVLGSINDVMNGKIMIVTHHELRSAMIMWLRVIIFTIFVLYAGLNFGEDYIAPAVAFSQIVVFPIILFSLSRSLKAKCLDILSVLIRPVLASLLMGIIIQQVGPYYSDEFSLIRMVLDIIIGVFSYVFFIFVLWLLTSRPAGLEKVIFQSIYNKIKLI